MRFQVDENSNPERNEDGGVVFGNQRSYPANEE